MGCLLVVVLAGVSAASVYLLGYPLWTMVVLGLLWLAAMVLSLLRGHTGFGSHGNTDLMIVIAGFVITASILFPKYVAQKPCDQPRRTLEKLAEAENRYFSEHKTFTIDAGALKMTRNPDVHIIIYRGDDRSFAAAATHRSCTDNNGTPKVFIWDSGRGGLQ